MRREVLGDRVDDLLSRPTMSMILSGFRHQLTPATHLPTYLPTTYHPPPSIQRMPLKIIVRENGPFAVDLSTGDLLLVDHLGNEIPLPQPKPGKTTITLCRCGASSNKPFCDSTHSKNLPGLGRTSPAIRPFTARSSRGTRRSSRFSSPPRPISTLKAREIACPSIGPVIA